MWSLKYFYEVLNEQIHILLSSKKIILTKDKSRNILKAAHERVKMLKGTQGKVEDLELH